jgi:hypothetical protein
MSLYLQTDWPGLLKIYGPLGVFCGLAIIFVKVLLNYIKNQHREHVQVLQGQAEDARKERDYSRQLRELEVNKFIDSLKLRDEKMERGFDEVVRALQDTRRK